MQDLLNQETQNAGMIHPLNSSSICYKQIFREPLPHHLGIALITLSNGDVDLPLSLNTACAGTILREYLAYDEFRHEFHLDEVGNFAVHLLIIDSPPTLSEMSLQQRCWRYHGAFLQVVFFDAQRSLTQNDILGLSVAHLYLDRWNAECGTTEPSAHPPLFVGQESAAAYDRAVGTLYSSGAGKWSQSLVVFRNALMVGLRRCLADKSMLEGMREFVLGGYENYWDVS